MAQAMHYGTQIWLAVPEWLEPFWPSSYATGRARMAQAIMALKYGWQCQNGSSHSCTQVNAMHWPNLSARMARAILAQPCRLHDLSARMARAILTWPVA